MQQRHEFVLPTEARDAAFYQDGSMLQYRQPYEMEFEFGFGCLLKSRQGSP